MKTIRERLVIYKLAINDGLDYEEVRDAIFDNRINYKMLIESINEEKITLQNLVDGEYLKDSYYYYNTEEYRELHDGSICHQDECFWCEGNNEYYHDDDGVTCYRYRDSYTYSSDFAKNNSRFYYYDGDYYDSDALERNNLVIDINGDVCNQDDVYYWESDGEYHHEEEREDYVRPYHYSSKFTSKFFSTEPKFLIGFEIEKEDRDVKESMYIQDFEDNCPGWRKERDGSLDDESGYELISPTFELNTDEIFKLIKNNKTLVSHINAEKSNSCGGHINVSQVGLTGHELFDKVKGFTPFIHALYWKRIDKNYSKGKSNKTLKDENEKYQSVRIHNNRIEYRIISAVPDVRTLEWRTKLIELIMENQTDCPKQAFFLLHTENFMSHVRKMYSPDRWESLINRVVRYTLEFEGIVLNKDDINKAA